MANYNLSYTGAQIDAKLGNVTRSNCHLVDATETDQGVATATADQTMKDFVTAIGTSEIAIISLRHNGTGNTTTYTLLTSLDLSSYSNIYLEIEPGAIIQPAAGVTLTVYSPEHILASPRQQIVDETNNAVNPFKFTTPEGKAYSGWFNSLEAFQESDAGYFVISEDASISATVDFDQAGSVIEFISGAKVTTTDNTKNGFTISGNNCKVINAYMQGPGTYVYDGSTEAALIYVSGADCEIISPWIINPPSHGIFGEGADRLKIHHGTFTTTATNANPGVNTYNMAIKAKDCEDVNIHHNDIAGETSGPTGFTEGIKISDATSLRPQVYNNNIRNTFDHAIYGGGEYENFSNNHITHNQVSCGTAIIGQRSYGEYNNNIITTIGGGITVRDANYSSAIGNKIYDSSTSGSPKGIVFNVHTSGNLISSTIANNDINLLGSSSSNGIEVITNTGAEVLNGNSVKDNFVAGACQDAGEGAIYMLSHGEGDGNSISGNTIDTSGADGIVMSYTKNSRADNNILIDIATRAFELTDINNSIFSKNIIVDEVGGVTDSVFKEIDSASTCANNRYIDNEINCSGLASSNFYDLTSNDFTARIMPEGKTWALAGATTPFYVGDGFIHFVDPQASGRDFNPAGEWPNPCVVTVINLADAAEQIDFDQTSLNQAILQNERGMFGFDGTSWYKIYVGS